MHFSFRIIFFILLTVCFAAGQVRITPEGFESAKQPQVAIRPDGVIYVTFGMSNTVYCVRSDDRGSKFSKPKAVATLKKLALGMQAQR